MAQRKTLADVANASDDWTPEERAFIGKAEAKLQEETDISELNNQEVSPRLVPKSVRIEQAVDNALTQAAADRKVRGLWPQKHQQIINEALKAWLKNEGYWIE